NICDLFSFDDRKSWCIPVTTSLRRGALDELNHLLHRLASLPDDIFSCGPASISWTLDSSSCFTVSSMRSALTLDKFPGVLSFPYETIWENYIPLKVQCFCWKTFQKKIATLDNLQRRGFQLANRCPLCQIEIETLDHLFLRCSFSSLVWGNISSRLSMYDPTHSSTREFIAAWKGLNCLSRFQTAMKVIMHATLWNLWLERNERIFNDKVSSSDVIFKKSLLSAGNWLGAAGLFSKEKLLEWNKLIFDPG
ncbi:Putative ribonuclease H protein At1g65750, partial [Linum grandiflorum]